MTIKIAGKLPNNDDRNGIGALGRDPIAEPTKQHLAVVVLTTSKITRDIENYDTIPTLKIVAIEPIVGGVDVGRLRAMLQRAHADRTGMLELPAEWEEVLSGLADSDGVIGGAR
jgi:hypothetical protein